MLKNFSVHSFSVHSYSVFFTQVTDYKSDCSFIVCSVQIRAKKTLGSPLFIYFKEKSVAKRSLVTYISNLVATSNQLQCNLPMVAV